LSVQKVLWEIIHRAFPASGLASRFGSLSATESSQLSKQTPSIVRFQASATEQEIWAGALSVPDAREHVLALVREIDKKDVGAFIERAKVDSGVKKQLKSFVDLLPDASRDEVAQNAHEALKQALRSRLGKNYCELEPQAQLRDEPIAWTANAPVDRFKKLVSPGRANVVVTHDESLPSVGWRAALMFPRVVRFLARCKHVQDSIC
jgi:hypothetical protein